MAKKVGKPTLRGKGLKPPGGQSMPKVKGKKPGKGIGNFGGGQLANKVGRKSTKFK